MNWTSFKSMTAGNVNQKKCQNKTKKTYLATTHCVRDTSGAQDVDKTKEKTFFTLETRLYFRLMEQRLELNLPELINLRFCRCFLLLRKLKRCFRS